tara:strand:- start:45 stop:302 length:258 start_codon:yes stop_codon:yes gene_type:complete
VYSGCRAWCRVSKSCYRSGSLTNFRASITYTGSPSRPKGSGGRHETNDGASDGRDYDDDGGGDVGSCEPHPVSSTFFYFSEILKN